MLDSVLRLGNTVVEGRLWLAPMAGVTDLPFRVVTAQLGCPFSVTEMVSAKGIYYGGKSIELLQHTPEQGKQQRLPGHNLRNGFLRTEQSLHREPS